MACLKNFKRRYSYITLSNKGLRRIGSTVQLNGHVWDYRYVSITESANDVPSIIVGEVVGSASNLLQMAEMRHKNGF